MGDFKLKIDIAKPDVAAAERGLKSIFKELEKIDKKAASVDRRMKRLGTGGKGGDKQGASSKFGGGGGILGGFAAGGAAAAALTALRAVSGAINTAGNAAKRAAIDFGEFQDNIVSISRISGIAESEIAEMSGAFLKLSSNIPVSAIQLQKFAETASRFGIKSSEGIQAFAETFGKLQSIIGPITEDTTKSVARIANLTNFPIENIDNFANAVLNLGKNFATTEDQIIRTAARVAGSTAAFGVTADEALGLAAALDSLNVNAELGGSALLRVFNALQDSSLKGGGDLQKLASIAGMTNEEFSRMALVSPVKALQALTASGAESFEIMDRLGLSGVRVQDVLGKLVSRSDDFAKAMDISSRSMENSLQLQSDAERQADTLASRYTRLGNAVSAAFISIGGEGSDASGELKGLTDELIEMAEAFTDADSKAAKAFPGMADLGESVKDLFETGVSALRDMAAGFEKLAPLVADIVGLFSELTSFIGNTVKGIGELWEMSNEPIEFRIQFKTEDLTEGNFTDKILSGTKNNSEDELFLDLELSLPNTEDIFKDSFKSLDEIAKKTIPGMSSQLDKYKDKAADIFFNNSLKGLGAGEKRLKQLQRGFKTRTDELDPKVNEAVALLAQNEEFKFLSDEDLVNLTQLVKKSVEMAEKFKDVEAALTADIQIDKINDAVEELKKLDLDKAAISKKIRDVTAGPAPDVDAIQSIEQTASFIADSKRADKEAEFARAQLLKQQEVIDNLKIIAKAAKKDAEDKLAIANFRNRP